MLGLAVAYLVGREGGRKRERREAVKPDVNGQTGGWIVGTCTVAGATIGGMAGGDEAATAGFGLGLAIGVTIWLLVAAIQVGRFWTITVVTVVGGMWVGYLVGGPDGILTGAYFGSALLVGWILARFVYWLRGMLQAADVEEVVPA